MKRIRKAITVLIIFAMLQATFVSVYAVDTTTEYVENHVDFDFSNISFTVSEQNSVTACVMTRSAVESRLVNNTIDDLYAYFEKYPQAEKTFAEIVSRDGETLIAMSYTEVPLELVDGHYERIAKENRQTTDFVIGDPSPKGNFVLETYATRSVNMNTNGTYTYYGYTHGYWTAHSALGGSNYPATDDDHIVQSAHNSLDIIDCDLTVTYTNGNYGQSGSHYSCEDIGEEYVQYDVKDDPIGTAQMDEILLACSYEGFSSSLSRKIYSSYVHTWMSVDVDISFTYGADATEIVIDPENSTKHWTVESFVVIYM